MAYLGNTLINGSLRCLNKAYFNDLSIGSDVEIAGKTTTNQLVISSDYNPSNLASANSSTAAIPLVIGNPTGVHIAMDADEIQFKNNATSNRAGYINYGGGRIYLSNGTKIYADNGVFKADSLGTSDSRIPNAYITTLDATTSNITTLKTADVTADNVTVNNVLKSSKWDISNVANLANDFMVAPTIKISSSGTVTIASLNTTAKTCRLTFSDASQINSDEFAGCRWYAGSKVRVTFTVSGTLNSNIEGTVVNNMNTTAGTLVVDVTLDNTTNLANGTYEADDSTIMLYEISNSGTLSPVGIRMTAYGTNNSSYIDMYGGTTSTDYTHPIVRIGRLNGITFNGKTFGTNALPAAWGIYTLNGYFEGAIVANEGKIANFTIASDKLYTGTHSAYNTNANGIFISDTYISFGKQAKIYFKNDGTGKIGNWTVGTDRLSNNAIGDTTSALVSTGTVSTANIGGSGTDSHTWVFTAGNKFGVTNEGVLYASDINVTGAVNATSLQVGNANSDHLIYSNGTIDLRTDWLRFDGVSTITIGKNNAPRVVIDGQSMRLKDKDNGVYFIVGDMRTNGVYTFTTSKPDIVTGLDVITGDGTDVIRASCDIDENYAITVMDEEGTDLGYSYIEHIESGGRTYTNIYGNYPNASSKIFKLAYTTTSGVYNFRYGYGTSYFSSAGAYSASFANNGIASAFCSFVTGSRTTASGVASFSTGTSTTASGLSSYAEGYKTVASGKYSHAEGTQSQASGIDSHAEGDYTKATNYCSHAEGDGTEASGEGSHSEGYWTKAKGKYSHAEGKETIATLTADHAEGWVTTASGGSCHAEGDYTTASGGSSHAEGSHTTASGDYSHSEGYGTTASNGSSHAENYYTTASGNYSHAEGNHTTASNESSHAEGTETHATGKYSHAEGYQTWAYFDCSHAEGYKTEANRHYAHTEGRLTKATGVCGHAEGDTTVASGNYSHAEGHSTTASGDYSHANGYSVYATADYQTTIGKYNTVTSTTGTNGLPIYNAGNYAFIIGNGTADNARSNALTVSWNGNLYCAGSVSCTGITSTGTISGTSISCSSVTSTGTITGTTVSCTGITSTGSISGTTISCTGITNTGNISCVDISCEDITATGKVNNVDLYCISTEGTLASSNYQTAIGKYNIEDTNNAYAFIIGNGTNNNNRSNALTVDWTGSVASGNDVTASGESSIATGCETVASGFYSHAEGLYSVASNTCSHASGEGTYATAANQTTIGKYNAVTIDSTFDPPLYDAGNYAFIIGNGTADNTRSNALTVDWNGNIKIYNPNLAVGTTPSSNNNNMALFLGDKDGNRMGCVAYNYGTNGDIGIILQGYRNVNNTNYYNTLNLSVDTSGDYKVTVSAPAAWRDGLGLSEMLSVDTKQFISKSPSVTIGTTPSSNYYLNGFTFRDKNNIGVGSFQLTYLNNGQAGVTMESQRTVNGTTSYNSLRLLQDTSGNAVVNLNASAWRTALQLNNILDLFRVVSFKKTNVSVSANGTASAAIPITIPSGFTAVCIINTRCDVTDTTSGTNYANCFVYNSWISGTTANVGIKNVGSSAAKVTAWAYILFDRNTL